MTEAPKRPRGRPATGGEKRFIHLPADLLARWDAATPDQRKAALAKGLP